MIKQQRNIAVFVTHDTIVESCNVKYYEDPHPVNGNKDDKNMNIISSGH